MVFTKLSDQQKEELAIFKAEHGTNLTSSMRALVMRGSTTDDAKKMVLSRQIARAELIQEMEKADSYKELQEAPTPEIIKKPRAPRKPKTDVDKSELKVVPEEEPKEDFKHIKITPPKPKKEAKPKKVAKVNAVEVVDDSSNINILL